MSLKKITLAAQIRELARKSPMLRVRLALESECEKLGFRERRQYFVDEAVDAIRYYSGRGARAAERQRLLDATRKMHSAAATADKLCRRRTFRRGQFNQKIVELAIWVDKLVRAESFLFGFYLQQCGVTGQTVKWATGQPRPACMACAESEQRSKLCDCLEWPAGSPFDLSFDGNNHWIKEIVFAGALKPSNYTPEQWPGLVKLFAARLSPQSPLFAKHAGRPMNEDDNELMCGLLDAFESAFERRIYRSSKRAMNLLQTVLDVFRLDHIALSYHVKKREVAHAASEREFRKLHAQFRHQSL